MSLVCTNTESSSFPAGSFHVNGSDGSKFVFPGVAPSGRSARPFLALFGEEKREGTTLEQQETRKTEEKNIIMGVFFRASAVNAKRDDDDDIDALRTNLLLFLCRFFFFLSFVHNKTIRYDPNTFTPNNIIFLPLLVCASEVVVLVSHTHR